MKSKMIPNMDEAPEIFDGKFKGKRGGKKGKRHGKRGSRRRGGRY